MRRPLLLLTLGLSVPSVFSAQAPAYDLILRGGRIIDGTGSPWYRAENFASFIGQGAVRTTVIGAVNRAATPEELDGMRGLVRQGMTDRALGLSSGLFYVPGRFTPTEEVVELARVAGTMGGIYISHMRDEAKGELDWGGRRLP
jgi:N-acyl-D-aspartate/D-glutamate deacylase